MVRLTLEPAAADPRNLRLQADLAQAYDAVAKAHRAAGNDKADEAATRQSREVRSRSNPSAGPTSMPGK